METSQDLVLKWPQFKDNFVEQFEPLRKEQEFVDVTLSCGGKKLRAHKVILAAASPYLSSLLKDNPCKHPVIMFENFRFDHLEAMLAFIYTGTTTIRKTDLREFIKTTAVLEIRGLYSPHILENRTGRKRPFCEATTSPRKKPANEPRPPEMTRNVENPIRQDQPVQPNHQEVNGQNSSDPRQCPICKRLYSNLSNLRQHLRLIHNPTIVTCKLCSKAFKTQLYLQRHFTSFHGLSISPENGERDGVGPPDSSLMLDSL